MNQRSTPGGPNLSRVLAITAAVLAMVGAVLILVYAIDVVLLVFAGILVAIMLRGLAAALARRAPLSERVSLAIVAVTLIALVVAAGWLFGPDLPRQIGELSERLPAAARELEARVRESPGAAQLLDRLPSAASLMPPRPDLLARVTGLFSTTFGVLANLLIVLAIGVYLAVDPRTYVEGFTRLFPASRRARVRDVLQQLGTTLAWWLAGKGLEMVVVGLLTALGLWLLGIPFVGALALIAALFNFVPYVGPIVALLPAALLALVESPVQALYVVGLYMAIQAGENYLLMPLVQQRTVSLPPALTLAAIMLAGVLAGGLGLLLATPLAAAGLVLVRTLYLEDRLGEPPPGDR